MILRGTGGTLSAKDERVEFEIPRGTGSRPSMDTSWSVLWQLRAWDMHTAHKIQRTDLGHENSPLSFSTNRVRSPNSLPSAEDTAKVLR
jgi:hypothetical protein